MSTGTLTVSGAATAASFAATGALTGATLTITGAASAGPLDCESLDCAFTATSGGVSTGSVVCGDVTSSGTVSAPQLFASNTLTVTNTSDFSDDLFLTKNWAGWSKLQVSNNSAAPDSGPELRLLGNQSARVLLERDGGAHQCELIMINDEALVHTKSLSTQLPLTTNQRNPGCLAIAGNTGNVVCNTSFTDLSDSRVKTEIAEADVTELMQLFDSVEAKQYKRPDMNGGLRLGFASDDFAGTKWKNLTGTTRWSDGTEMVTLDYSRLTSVLWGGECARASSLAGAAGAEEQVKKLCEQAPFWGNKVFRPPRSRGTLNSSFLGQQVGVCRPHCIQGRQRKLLFGAKLNGGAEGPGRRLQRAGPAEAVPTCEAARST